MLSGCSNCSRVDAVKATADLLKLQVPRAAASSPNAGAADSASSNAKVAAANRQLQSVDAQVRTGDATKAELALSAARAAVDQIQYSAPTATPAALQIQSTRHGSLDLQA
jgi:type VI protein secretion system component VasK